MTQTEKENLHSFVERIERLTESKDEISSDIKQVYEEAKSSGFEVKILKKLIRIRKQGLKQRVQEEEILTLYMNFLNMLK